MINDERIRVKLGLFGEVCLLTTEDGVDLSQYCRAFTIKARVGELTTIRPEFMFVETEGEARLDLESLRDLARSLGYRLEWGTEDAGPGREDTREMTDPMDYLPNGPKP